MNYWERHIGDYARDTAHLSLLEHGVYTLLLDRYYATEAPIPEDQAHRVARARSKEEKAAVDAVLSEFFTLAGGVWTNGRCDEEIEKARIRIETAKANGKRGGRPKKNPAETHRKPSGLLAGYENETQQKAHHAPDTTLLTETPLHRTRDARAPGEEIVGVFEGHDDPMPTAARPEAVPMAVLLNRAGYRCTTLNPDLIAYVDGGGTTDHLAQVAAQPDCAGKSATYVLRFARRELTQPAAAIPAGATHAANHAGQTHRLSAVERVRANIEAAERRESAGPDAITHVVAANG